MLEDRVLWDGAQQKMSSRGICLKRGVGSHKSAGFCIFPYLYMKISRGGSKATEIKTRLSELENHQQISNRPFNTNVWAWRISELVARGTAALLAGRLESGGTFQPGSCPMGGDIGLLALPLGAVLLSCVCCDGLGVSRGLIFVAACLWCPKSARDAGGRAGMGQRNVLHPAGAVLCLCSAFLVETNSFSCALFLPDLQLSSRTRILQITGLHHPR